MNDATIETTTHTRSTYACTNRTGRSRSRRLLTHKRKNNNRSQKSLRNRTQDLHRTAAITTASAFGARKHEIFTTKLHIRDERNSGGRLVVLATTLATVTQPKHQKTKPATSDDMTTRTAKQVILRDAVALPRPRSTADDTESHTNLSKFDSIRFDEIAKFAPDIMQFVLVTRHLRQHTHDSG